MTVDTPASVEGFKKRIEDLERQLKENEELKIALLDLRIAHEELEAQNQELIAIRNQLEIERRRYLDLFEYAPDGYLVTDVHAVIFEANRAAEKMLKADKKALIGGKLAAYIQATDRPVFFSLLRSARRDKPELEFKQWDLHVELQDGETLQVLLSVAQIREQSGAISGLRWSLHDINKRKQVEQALRESERLLRQVMEILPVGVWITDANGVILTANEAALKIWGGAHYVGIDQYGEYKTWSVETGQQISNEEQAAARAIRNGETTINEELAIEAFDGARKTILNSSLPIRNIEGKISGAIIVNHDITHRKQIEEEVKRSEGRAKAQAHFANQLTRQLEMKALLQTICEETAQALETSAASISLYNAQTGDFCVAADTGLPEDKRSLLQNMPFSSIKENALKPGAVAKFTDVKNLPPFVSQEWVKACNIHSLATATLFRDGKAEGALTVYSIGRVRNFSREDLLLFGALADQAALAINNARLYRSLQEAIAQEKALHFQLLEAEKHMAISRMVGSVAHELNNPIQTIQNCMYLAQDELEDGSPLKEYLNMATGEAKRIARLVDQLRNTYRPSKAGKKGKVDLGALLEEVHSLLEAHLQHENCKWTGGAVPEEGLEPLMVEGNADQLKQVFLNICMNAIEAMQPGGGEITASGCLRKQEAESWIGITIRDRGPGIPPENIPRLYEPFFTTKEGGTGLGLSICYEIIQNHNGTIEVESALGKGAAFTVWLKRV